MLVSHRDDVLTVGGERHVGDAIIMRLNLSHLGSAHLPHAHAGHVTTLKQIHENQTVSPTVTSEQGNRIQTVKKCC